MTYESDVKAAQIRWRKRHLPGVIGWGAWANKHYEHILPWEDRFFGLWPGIRSDVLGYLEEGLISPHPSWHHLNSSWTLAANAFFPFRSCQGGQELLASFLAAHVAPEIVGVSEIELEFQDPPPFDQESLLGETGGRRGQGQTSPDVGVKVTDETGARGVVLFEVKYKESDFEDCSQYKKLEGGERSACHGLRSLIADPGRCPFTESGRRYIPILRAALSAGMRGSADRPCPAANGGYQLARQQALAEALVAAGAYGFAISTVIVPMANNPIHRIDQTSTLSDWGSIFDGQSRFVTVHFEDLLGYVESTDGPAWTAEWVDYMRSRYFAAR